MIARPTRPTHALVAPLTVPSTWIVRFHWRELAKGAMFYLRGVESAEVTAQTAHAAFLAAFPSLSAQVTEHGGPVEAIDFAHVRCICPALGLT